MISDAVSVPVRMDVARIERRAVMVPDAGRAVVGHQVEVAGRFRLDMIRSYHGDWLRHRNMTSTMVPLQRNIPSLYRFGLTDPRMLHYDAFNVSVTEKCLISWGEAVYD